MRRVGDDAIHTINAAAAAIASAENRSPHVSPRKRRWASFLGIYWCFGLSKNKRIGHAVLVPEASGAGTEASSNEHLSQPPPSIALPFVAPPSSPVSFLPSEPPSATQSPTALLTLSVSSSMYSPGPSNSIFAIGPYAHEPQLVSPPVFSTFTTEPSTAPYTPPPESIHMTAPLSPEVPFARFVESNIRNGESVQRYPFFQYEFQSYQLQPGSPVSHLISPSSGISGSGTSSPFPDRELTTAGHPFFIDFKTGNPPKLLDLDKIVIRECESCQGSGAVTPDPATPTSSNTSIFHRQNSDIAPLPVLAKATNVIHDSLDDGRVSFERTEEEIIRCVEKKKGDSGKLVERKTTEMANARLNTSGSGEASYDISGKSHLEDEKELQRQKHRTITLGSSKEFNFDNAEGGNLGDEPSIDKSEWWVNSDKVERQDQVDAAESETTPSKNWSFFPMMQTRVS